MSTDETLGKALKASEYIASSGVRSRDPHKSHDVIDQVRIKLLSEGISRLMLVYSASHEEIVSAIKLIALVETLNQNQIEKSSWPNHIPNITNCGNMFNI